MSSDNGLHFVGTVITTPIGTPCRNGIMLKFTVQIVERWTSRDGTHHEDLTDVELAVFGDQATGLEAGLRIGMCVDVEGKLSMARGNRKSDNRPYAILKVKPSRVEIVGNGAERQEELIAPTPTPTQTPTPSLSPARNAQVVRMLTEELEMPF